jgi:hypothetical protein
MVKHITIETFPKISNLNRDEAGADQYVTPGLFELALQAVIFLSSCLYLNKLLKYNGKMALNKW